MSLGKSFSLTAAKLTEICDIYTYTRGIYIVHVQLLYKHLIMCAFVIVGILMSSTCVRM